MATGPIAEGSHAIGVPAEGPEPETVLFEPRAVMVVQPFDEAASSESAAR